MKSFEDKEGRQWVCTDGSNLQYGREISNFKFSFLEFDRDSYPIEFEELCDHSLDIDLKDVEDHKWIDDTIDLTALSKKEVEDAISGYYDSLDEVKEQYGDDWRWIVAECVFEYTNGLY
jgi:hypothetical protein